MENVIPQQLSIWEKQNIQRGDTNTSALDLVNEINKKIGSNHLSSGAEFIKSNQSQIDNGKFLKNYDSHIVNSDLRKSKKIKK
jgi:DNA polymerase-4